MPKNRASERPPVGRWHVEVQSPLHFLLSQADVALVLLQVVGEDVAVAEGPYRGVELGGDELPRAVPELLLLDEADESAAGRRDEPRRANPAEEIY